jgi:multidrug transporter EmrE-like cation transporter
MSKLGFLLTVFAAFMTAVANICLRNGVKQSLQLTGGAWHFTILFGNVSFIAGCIFYGFALFTWLKILALEPIGISYPVLIGLTFALLMAGSAYFAHEPISLKTIVGTLIIFVGITIIARP